MKILTINDIKTLVNTVGINNFCLELIAYLEEDFKKWEQFTKIPRPAVYSKEGVIELMPTANQEFYTYKYVNGHPNNPKVGESTVMATGQLSLVKTGKPLLFSEMTLLTAFRTACTSAMAGKYLANKNASTIAIIGTGAQSEFQLQAFLAQFPSIKNVYYFDIDKKAMEKFATNLTALNVSFYPCCSVLEAVKDADIITTITASKKRNNILTKDMLKGGTFINAVGGDSKDKTELDEELIKLSKIVVEYIPQTLTEGEVQYLGAKSIYAELWEIISNNKPGRSNNQEITIFDSVGFAIEDFSTLRLVYDLAKKYNIGENLNIVPQLENPKNLFSLLNN